MTLTLTSFLLYLTMYIKNPPFDQKSTNKIFIESNIILIINLSFTQLG